MRQGEFPGQVFKGSSTESSRNTAEIDYDQVDRLAQEHKPKIDAWRGSPRTRESSTSRASGSIADSVALICSSTWRTAPVWWRPGCIPNPVPIADVVTTTTHKTLRAPGGGLILARPHADWHKKLNPMVFPGIQGGPLMHVIAAKAVASWRPCNRSSRCTRGRS